MPALYRCATTAARFRRKLANHLSSNFKSLAYIFRSMFLFWLPARKTRSSIRKTSWPPSSLLSNWRSPWTRTDLGPASSWPTSAPSCRKASTTSRSDPTNNPTSRSFRAKSGQLGWPPVKPRALRWRRRRRRCRCCTSPAAASFCWREAGADSNPSSVRRKWAKRSKEGPASPAAILEKGLNRQPLLLVLVQACLNFMDLII